MDTEQFDHKMADIFRQLEQNGVLLNRVSMAMMHAVQQAAIVDDTVFDEPGGDHFFDALSLDEDEKPNLRPKSYVERLQMEVAQPHAYGLSA